MPEVRAWNKTTAFCYAAQHAPVDGAIILFPEEQQGKGALAPRVVNDVSGDECAVQPAYAPPGGHLIVASMVGEAPANDTALTRLDEGVRTQMRRWFGPAVDSSLRMLRAYPLAQALPQQRHAEWEQMPVPVGVQEGFTCAEHPGNGVHSGRAGFWEARPERRSSATFLGRVN